VCHVQKHPLFCKHHVLQTRRSEGVTLFSPLQKVDGQFHASAALALKEGGRYPLCIRTDGPQNTLKYGEKKVSGCCVQTFGFLPSVILW
jgi:hypothetical protein